MPEWVIGMDKDKLTIAVLSGKGGTGKTLISTNLAAVLEEAEYLDCDVEEPNGFIFLKPNLVTQEKVNVPNPVVDKEKCLACGQCVQACQFNCLALVKEQVLFFPKICHSCGTCSLVCPAGAIQEIEREIGVIEQGVAGNLTCYQGKLNVGEPIAVPIIKQLKEKINSAKNTVLDCPPGSSCSVVNSIAGSDFCLLVTEPTPFGLHDLQIAVNLVRKMHIPLGVVINKADITSQHLILKYCQKEKIPVLALLAFSKEVAKIYSQGELLVDKEGNYWKVFFSDLAQRVKEVLKNETVSSN